MPVFNNILAGAAGQGGAAAAGPIKSVRFNNDDSAYLNRSATDSGSNVYKYTVSWWMKIGSIGTDKTIVSFATNNAVNGWTKIHLRTDNRLSIFGDSTGTALSIRPTMLFRDPNAWYHCVVSLDTTQSTYSDQAKFYVNGVQQTDYTGTLAFAQNTALSIGEATTHHVGTEPNSLGSLRNYFDGYIADLHVIEGQVKEATDFGAFDDNGVWQAAAYTGTYGTNGFHLFDFANESGIGNDSSGNDNDFSVNNISSTAGAGNDVLFDVPTNGDSSDDTGAGGEVSGNYCTWNPLSKDGGTTYSNGNLDISSTNYGNNTATFFLTSGKWYWEGQGAGYVGAVCGKAGQNFATSISVSGSNSIGWWQNGPVYWDGGNNSGTTSYGSSDIIGTALDMDNGKVYFYKNGTLTYTITFGSGTVPDLSDGVFPCYNNGQTSGTKTITYNFGQRPFAYSAPSGFSPICSTLLPTPTIADGSDYFDATLYTGTGASKSITSLGFSPDWVWIKPRSDQTYDWHTLLDTVRGTNKELNSNYDSAEFSATDGLNSFDSNGFTLGTRATMNESGGSYVAWAWDAGSSTVSNTDGDITANVRVNQTAGFSVVSYTGSGSSGDSIGHGLNAVPGMIWVKNRDTAGEDWYVYHKSIGNTNALKLNKDEGKNPGQWNSTDPTSSVFTVSSLGDVNGSGEDMVAYCFSAVKGYSAIGEYQGNGTAGNGTFVALDFAPAFVMVKRHDGDGNWTIWDSKRPGYNLNDDPLYPNLSSGEGSAYRVVDLLSNGFKLRDPGGNATALQDTNTSGAYYIYYAVAENPFQANGGLAR